MKLLRTIIVDDEFMARESLQKILKAYCKNIDIVGEASNIDAAEKIILSENPDLLILDIRMPNGTGFDLLCRFQKIDFHIIFITAYDEYAVKAFRYSAIDYLLKPIEPNQLIHAINKISTNKAKEDLIDKINQFLAKYPADLFVKKKIQISTSTATFFIDLEKLIHAETENKYARLIFKDRDDIVISKSLSDFEKMAKDYKNIFRVHKSHLINLDHVVSLDRKSNSMLVTMIDNTKVEVSNRRRELLINALMEQVE